MRIRFTLTAVGPKDFDVYLERREEMPAVPPVGCIVELGHGDDHWIYQLEVKAVRYNVMNKEFIVQLAPERDLEPQSMNYYLDRGWFINKELEEHAP